MPLAPLDLAVFVTFYAIVLGVAFFASRRGRTSVDYFLGGRSLPWWLIGISIVAANISTEQMVGMAGQGAGGVGLAVSAWQLVGSHRHRAHRLHAAAALAARGHLHDPGVSRVSLQRDRRGS